MAGVYRAAPPRPPVARPGAALLGGGAPRTIAAFATLGPLTGVAFATAGATRLAVGGGLLGPLTGTAVVATGLWTPWTALRVTLVPGAIWDDGDSLWDGGAAPEDNDGAVWDAGSGFGAGPPVPLGPWTTIPAAPGFWENAIR